MTSPRRAGIGCEGPATIRASTASVSSGAKGCASSLPSGSVQEIKTVPDGPVSWPDRLTEGLST